MCYCLVYGTIQSMLLCHGFENYKCAFKNDIWVRLGPHLRHHRRLEATGLKGKGLLDCILIVVCELSEHDSTSLNLSFLTSKRGQPFPGVNAAIQ